MKINTLLQELQPFNAKLVAVSKTKPTDLILQFYNQGHRIFGENRAQEMKEKHEILPKDIQWHMVGHLQTNKVKYIAPFVKLIHSVDSLKLLKEINKQALKNDRVIDVLLEFKIAAEDSKYGLDLPGSREILSSPAYQQLQAVRITGVMGMATFTDDEQQVRKEFQYLKSIFNDLKKQFFTDNPYFKEVSMGMTGDYKIALEEGSTMVRIGTLLFGKRE